jgi:hypothetical protein
MSPGLPLPDYRLVTTRTKNAFRCAPVFYSSWRGSVDSM